jgi:hypothetical protein
MIEPMTLLFQVVTSPPLAGHVPVLVQTDAPVPDIEPWKVAESVGSAEGYQEMLFAGIVKVCPVPYDVDIGIRRVYELLSLQVTSI